MILITGGNGAVGSKLSEMLQEAGYLVTISSRFPKTRNQVRWRIEDKFELESSIKITGIIHCAYDFKSSKLNSIGAETMSKYANEIQVPLINVSSVLAEFQQSTYGSNKREIEDIVRSANQFNFRVGVISSYPAISSIQTLQRMRSVLPFFPFPGIQTHVYETRIDSLFAAITKIFDQPAGFPCKDIYVVEPIRRPLFELVSESVTDGTVGHKYYNVPIGITVKVFKFVSLFAPKFRSVADSFNGNHLLSKKRKFDLEADWISLS